jgi:hypothetical protein
VGKNVLADVRCLLQAFEPVNELLIQLLQELEGEVGRYAVSPLLLTILGAYIAI